jgi:hypothetical protein
MLHNTALQYYQGIWKTCKLHVLIHFLSTSTKPFRIYKKLPFRILSDPKNIVSYIEARGRKYAECQGRSFRVTFFFGNLVGTISN